MTVTVVVERRASITCNKCKKRTLWGKTRRGVMASARRDRWRVRDSGYAVCIKCTGVVPVVKPPRKYRGEMVYDYNTAMLTMETETPGLNGCLGCFRCRAGDHGSCHGCVCRCQGEYGGEKCPMTCAR